MKMARNFAEELHEMVMSRIEETGEGYTRAESVLVNVNKRAKLLSWLIRTGGILR